MFNLFHKLDDLICELAEVVCRLKQCADCRLKECTDWNSEHIMYVWNSIRMHNVNTSSKISTSNSYNSWYSQLFQITHRMMRTMFYVHNMMRMWFKLHAHILSGENLDEKWAIIKLFDELETKMHLYGAKSELQVSSAHQV